MLIKKLLTCTDSIVVEAQKVLNRVAIETCFPCNPTIQERREDGEGGSEVCMYFLSVFLRAIDTTEEIWGFNGTMLPTIIIFLVRNHLI